MNKNIFIVPLFFLITACTTVNTNKHSKNIQYNEIEMKMYGDKTLESANMSEYDKLRYKSENNTNAIHWNYSKEFKRQLETEKK